MEDLFEGAFFGGVLKDYGAKLFSIQAAFARKNSGPKLSRELLFYLRVKIDKFPRGLIGVKNFCGRNKLAQTIAEGRLARGNSARDTNGRHLAKHQIPSSNIQGSSNFQFSSIIRETPFLSIGERLLTEGSKENEDFSSTQATTDDDFVTFASGLASGPASGSESPTARREPTARSEALRLLLVERQLGEAGSVSFCLIQEIENPAGNSTAFTSSSFSCLHRPARHWR